MMETLLSERFLPLLLNHLNMKEIVRLDSAVCSKHIREKWLECIAEGAASMVISDKIRPFRIQDRLIEWCSKRKVHLKHLYLDFTSEFESFPVSFHKATLLAMCCINLVDLNLCRSKKKIRKKTRHRIISELGQRCTRLKRFNITSMKIYDRDVAPFMSRNHDLKVIEIVHCYHISDATLIAIGENCHKLPRAYFSRMDRFTDQGIHRCCSQ